MSNLTADLYEDNNAGITLVIHDNEGNAKYIHTYYGTLTENTGFTIDSEHMWDETDAYSLGRDLIAFSQPDEDCEYWDNNQLGIYINGDEQPDEFNPRLKDDNQGVIAVAEQSYKTIATNLNQLAARWWGKKMIETGACEK